MTSLFIGVVSHEGTRFADSLGPTGLAATLAGALEPMGVASTVVMRTDDAHDPAALPIDGRLGWSSVRTQLALESAWDRYLAEDPAMPSRSALRDRLVAAARTVRAAGRYWRPWHDASATAAPEIVLVRRLVNIELSHLALMRQAVEIEADWALIVEDDAAAEDIEDCARGLASLLVDQGPPAYANVSRSFGRDALRIAPLLGAIPGVAWAGGAPRSVLASSRPVTDTVCAVLYRGVFLTELVRVLDALPMTPVVPIDWKLNVALMAMFEDGRIGPGDCWLVEPGPIVQRSMG